MSRSQRATFEENCGTEPQFSGYGSVKFRRYQPGDALAIGETIEGKVPHEIDALAQKAWAWSAVDPAGRVIASGGIFFEPGSKRGMGFSLLSLDLAPRQKLAIRDRMILALDEAHNQGIDTVVTECADGFEAGHTWVKGLGFRLVGYVPGPRGGAGFRLYAHVAERAQWAGNRVPALLDLLERTLNEGAADARQEVRHGN